MELELNFIIPCRSMINSLFKADERVYHFARQNEADPHAKYESDCRNNAQPPLDRKSTRLNSSHQIISYAVFCLKKKAPKSDSPRLPAIGNPSLTMILLRMV